MNRDDSPALSRLSLEELDLLEQWLEDDSGDRIAPCDYDSDVGARLSSAQR